MEACAHWCDYYPGSKSLDDLIEPFRSNVKAFVADLVARGCTVHVSATYRPPERAFLMHWAWKIHHDGASVNAPPVLAGVDIQWTVDGARDMCVLYGLVHEPALVSRHTQRRAVDMTITGIELDDAILIGAAYFVRKLAKDPPHWSDDGH